MNTFHMTSDASFNYQERSALDVARAQSSAQDGSIASLLKDTTVFVTPLIVAVGVQSTTKIYVEQLEEVGVLHFLPR
ncbi:MAG: hypothetical protein B7Z15_04045 [Rhizobiales bacterium 32-66-8]|nr:MAG: hypothetical protein B7Z15_04045 [Rhizobiales bacterium 32-66-8]